MTTNDDHFHLINTLTLQQEADIAQTLQATFGRKVIADYFDGNFSAIFVNKSCTAVAILKELSAYHYLDKFAIHPDLQNQGFGAKLWASIIAHTPDLIWRAKQKQSI